MKLISGFLLIFLLFFVSCSNPNQGTLQSWAFDVVTWNNEVYKVTNVVVSEVEDEIGMIKIHNTTESNDLPNLFSNRFEKGTQLYKIKNVDPSISIAVMDEGTYYEAQKM